jgi:hypothetical protein
MGDDCETTGGRNPRSQLRGNIFPAATQPVGFTASVYWGDAGDGEHDILSTGRIWMDESNAGRDTLPTLRPGSQDKQWDDAFGMRGANTSFRYRFLNSLNLGKFIRPTIGSYMNGRSDMRPTATAIHPRTMGEPPPMSITGGRMMAPGRVTRWEQASLIWPRFGRDNGSSQ